MRRLVSFLIAFFVLTPTAEAAWVWPVSGEVITPYRNGTDPYASGQHRGIDIAAPVGEPVVAATGGEVRFAGTAGSSGLTISIRTPDGYDTSYLHLSSVAVRAGAHVSTGDRIGAVGTTGVRSATAPHLHFGVRDAGTRHDYHDPLALLPPLPPAPAPEPPPAAPLAAPNPAPPPAIPVTSPPRRPVRRPHHSPVRRPHPGRHPVPQPVPHRLPHDSPVGRRVAHGLTRASPVRRAEPAPGHLPHGERDARHRPQGEHHPLARAATAPRTLFGGGRLERVREGRAVGAGARQASDPLTPAGADGPDLGWVVACAGLLLAAAVLGLVGDGPRADRRARSRFSGALPILGRR